MGQSTSSPLLANARAPFRLVRLRIAEVEPPAERLRFGLNEAKLEELAASIRERGLMQPAGVRLVDGRYQVVWGDHRTEALRRLGWSEADFFLVEAGVQESVVLSAVENLQRHDMSPVEEAAACQRLYEAEGEDVDRVAGLLNRSRAWVEARLRVMGWPADVQRAVHEGSISAAAGAELAPISDDEHRRFLLHHAVEGGATARTCQAWRIAWLQTGAVPNPSVVQVGPGGTAPAPVEAELPCYLCGERHLFSALQHVWLDAECFAVFQQVVESYRAGLAGR